MAVFPEELANHLESLKGKEAWKHQTKQEFMKIVRADLASCTATYRTKCKFEFTYRPLKRITDRLRQENAYGVVPDVVILSDARGTGLADADDATWSNKSVADIGVVRAAMRSNTTGARRRPVVPMIPSRTVPATSARPRKEGSPHLPVARASTGGQPSMADVPDTGDPMSCDYWRYCAIDGFLCSCCGGSVASCPPGTEMSPITWIGTCRNPEDGLQYVVSYNDCCGKTACGQCMCNRNEGDRPMYRPDKNNDINWCLGTKSSLYHCSTAVIIGLAVE